MLMSAAHGCACSVLSASLCSANSGYAGKCGVRGRSAAGGSIASNPPRGGCCGTSCTNPGHDVWRVVLEAELMDVTMVYIGDAPAEDRQRSHEGDRGCRAAAGRAGTGR